MDRARRRRRCRWMAARKPALPPLPTVSGAFAAGQEPRSGALSFSGADADQNEQPYAVSEAFVASIVCLQVASMVVFAEGFLAMSIHALRV